MNIIDWPVRSSIRREGEGEESLFSATSYTLSEYMIIWCKIQVIINPVQTDKVFLLLKSKDYLNFSLVYKEGINMMVYLFLTLSAAALTHLADGQSSRETERFLIDSPYNLCRQPLYRR